MPPDDLTELMINALIVLSMVSVGLLIVLLLEKRRYRAIKRTNELEMTAVALGTHLDAVTALAEDPDTPLPILDLLAGLTEGLSSKEYSLGLVDILTSPTPAKPTSQSSLWETRQELLATNPSLAEKFDLALMNGLVVAFLRFPETAPKFETFAASIMPNAHRRSDIAERAMQRMVEQPA